MSAIQNEWNKGFATMLRKFVSHRQVAAGEIVRVGADDTLFVKLEDGSITSFVASRSMFAHYRPVPGDALVVYDDGYAAVCPKASFDEGYKPVPA